MTNRKRTHAEKRRRLPEAISIRLAAELLDVSMGTIRRWIKYGIPYPDGSRGPFLAYRIGPQIVRIPRSEIARIRRGRLALANIPDNYTSAPKHP